MSLRITGPIESRANYDRVPMADDLGPVIAYLHQSRVEYRPNGGTAAEREARARMIAAQVGGEALVRHEASWVAVQRFTTAAASATA